VGRSFHAAVRETKTELEQVNVYKGERLRLIESSLPTTKQNTISQAGCTHPRHNDTGLNTFQEGKGPFLGTFFQNLGPKRFPRDHVFLFSLL
jgi:hypothetical protein